MSDVVAGVGTGAVTIASRDVQTNGVTIRTGQWLGLADGAPVAGGGSFEEVARAVVARLLDRPRGVLTLLVGEAPQPLETLLAEIASAHPEVEVDVREGGQPGYPLLLGAE
jgi:dihydroxyacetone kinase-like predicted kinase